MKGDAEKMHPLVRRAVPGDAAELAGLKLQTFRETFVDGELAIPYAEEDLAVFESQSYSLATVRDELEDAHHAQWVAEDESGALIGYAHVGPCKLPHAEANADHAEIYQLYVVDEWQGAGMGRVLLDTALNWVEESQPGPIWLGVFSGNLRAQAVYISRGFVKVGEYEFKVGDHRDREFIMRRG
ncbi:MAG: N-acetyltransferase [Sphingobium sp.]|nr:N-acetyltransferase [Sphingobium sp.]